MAKRKATEQPSVATESFEESLTELQSIVSELEDGSLGLETSLARFERGVRLLRTCYLILDSAEQKIETLTRFNDTIQSITSPPENAVSPGDIDSTDGATTPAHDADGTPDLNSAKSSLF